MLYQLSYASIAKPNKAITEATKLQAALPIRSTIVATTGFIITCEPPECPIVQLAW
jgi:hypothetical protein